MTEQLDPHEVEELARTLREGCAVDDVVFDRLYPASQRFRSWLHWTPLDIARRAAALLAPRTGSRVLDVGAGVGKVCLVGASITGARWVGIERDPDMVEAARAAASALGVTDRATFVCGDLADVPWGMFEGFYLFNPFAESLFTADEEHDALTRRERYIEHVAFVQDQLARAQVGTRVVTYHGFGGDVPPGFALAHREAAREDELCLWVRR